MWPFIETIQFALNWTVLNCCSFVKPVEYKIVAFESLRFTLSNSSEWFYEDFSWTRSVECQNDHRPWLHFQWTSRFLPLNVLCSDALSPALRSTGSCEQESSLFILPTNVHQLWQKPFRFSNEPNCCVRSTFLLRYYCVCCANDGRSAQRNPWQNSLALCVRMADWFLYSLNVL